VHYLSSGALVADGTLAQTATDKIAVPDDLLQGLSSGPFLFASGGVLPKKLVKAMMTYSMRVTMQMAPNGDLSQDDLQAVEESMAAIMNDMQSMSISMGTVGANQPVYEGTAFSLKVKNSAEFIDAYEKAMQRMNAIFGKADKPLFQYDISRSVEDGFDVLAIDADMTNFLQSQAQGGNQDQMMELMFGANGTLNIYLAAADKETVIGQYVSKDRLLKRLTSGSDISPLSQQSDAKSTLQMLPPTAQGVALWSLPGTLQMVSRIMEAQPNIPVQLPEFPDSPPVGMSMELTTQRLNVDTVLPAELLDAIAAYVRTIQANGVQR